MTKSWGFDKLSAAKVSVGLDYFRLGLVINAALKKNTEFPIVKLQ